MYHLLYLLFTTVPIHSVVQQLNEQRVKENMVLRVKHAQHINMFTYFE